MEIRIYFDYGIIIKPTYISCRLRSPTVASIQTSTVVYKYRKTFPHLHSLISSHLSLSLLRRKESLLYCAEKGLSLTHVKPEAAEIEATTADPNIDQRGPSNLLF